MTALSASPSVARRAPVSLLDCFKDPVPGQQVRACQQVGHHAVPVILSCQEAGAYPDPPVSEFNLQILLRNSARGTFDLGAGPRPLFVKPGQFVIANAGVETDYDFEVSGQGSDHAAATVTLLMIGLPQAVVARQAEERGVALDAGLPGLHEGALSDPTVLHLAETLIPDRHNPSLSDRTFVDHVVTALAARLLAMAEDGLQRPRTAPAAAFSDAECRALIRFIDERLDHPISVGDLASALDRSVSGLFGLFKQAFGKTPYSLVQERRVERARQLLGGRSLALAEIALTCGYSSQSHFTTAFRRAVGCTPAQYRASIKG
ncbi:MAG: helix-turn-helix domain-containing protein [Rhodothalassiaceae bacterium]